MALSLTTVDWMQNRAFNFEGNIRTWKDIYVCGSLAGVE